MSAALVDAGPLVALFAKREQRDAARYNTLLRKASVEQWALSTTWPCVVEASHFLDVPQRYSMLTWIGAGAVSVYPFSQESLGEMVALMMQYTAEPKVRMDLADASLVWLAADTGVTQIMTLDVRDFSRYRLPDGRAFDIL